MLTLRHIHFCWLVVLFLSLLLTGCGSSAATRPVLARTCMQVGGARGSTLNVQAPDAGTLRFQIQERGISVVATLDGDTVTAGESPVVRLGTIYFVARAKRENSHTFSVKANDTPDNTTEERDRAEQKADSD